MARREITLKRDALCAGCQGHVAAGDVAYWDQTAKLVTCLGCEWGMGVPSGAQPLDRGRPGESAQREYERRRRSREADTRARHPHIGELLLAVRTPPQHETAFRVGAEGERMVAAALERRTEKAGVVLLHDRRMPRGHGNIDHLAVAPSGVFVVDAKNHGGGKVTIARPLIGKAKLLLDGRDQTHLIDGMDRQVAAVTARLAAEGIRVPVSGILCFTKADLPVLFSLTMRGHAIRYPKGAAKLINAAGETSPAAMHATAATLARMFPSA